MPISINNVPVPVPGVISLNDGIAIIRRLKPYEFLRTIYNACATLFSLLQPFVGQLWKSYSVELQIISDTYIYYVYQT